MIREHVEMPCRAYVRLGSGILINFSKRNFHSYVRLTCYQKVDSFRIVTAFQDEMDPSQSGFSPSLCTDMNPYRILGCGVNGEVGVA